MADPEIEESLDDLNDALEEHSRVSARGVLEEVRYLRELLESNSFETTEERDEYRETLDKVSEYTEDYITNDLQASKIRREIRKTRSELEEDGDGNVDHARRGLLAGIGLSVLGLASASWYNSTHGVDAELQGYDDVLDAASEWQRSEFDGLNALGESVADKVTDSDESYILRLTDFYEDGTRVSDYRIELVSNGVEEEWEIGKELYNAALQEIDESY